MTFVERKIDITISLAPLPTAENQPAQATGQSSGQPRVFAGTKSDTVKLSNLRMSCKIVKAGGVSFSEADVRIWGLTQSIMDQLSTLGIQINLMPPNPITISAGDDTNGMAVVFVGYITQALADFQSSPEVVFVIKSHTMAANFVALALPTSFRGSADVGTIMSGFAALAGLKFENNGVNVSLQNQYFSGSIKEQAQRCVTAANIEWNGGDNGVIAIWPKFGARRSQLIPRISTETGMIGYPVYSPFGITVRSIFNPNVGLGQIVQVVSSLDRASGLYDVFSLDYDLESQLPDGQWSMTIGCHADKFPAPIVG